MLGGVRRCTTRAAIVASAARSMTCERLYVCAALLKRLPQHSEDMAAARRPRIHEVHDVVRQRHFPRHGVVPAADQAPHPRWYEAGHDTGGP